MSSRKHRITATCYDKRGRILSKCHNSYIKTHPLQAHFAYLAGKPECTYLHAEIAALISAKSVVYKILVERYYASGKPAMAKPCPICEKAIEAWGVKRIEYTIG